MLVCVHACVRTCLCVYMHVFILSIIVQACMHHGGYTQDGYLSLPGTVLTDEERTVLPALFLGRIAQSLAMGAYTAHKVVVVFGVSYAHVVCTHVLHQKTHTHETHRIH